MTTYAFLSDEWLSEARKIRDEYGGRAAPVPQEMKMNLVITDVPFGNGTIDAHMDSTDGLIEMGLGHVEPADLEVRLDYVTAKAILVERDAQTGMQAFMTGKVQVVGDLMKLMALQGIPPDAEAQEMAERLRRITA
jgi:putative sterol carrier protein